MYQLITTLASTIAKQVEYNKRSNGQTDASILYDEIIEHLSSNHNNVSIVEKSNKSPFRITKSTNFQYVLFNNGIELVVTSGLTLASGSLVALATVPAGFRPIAGTISFYCRVFKKATAPYTDPDGSFDARITIDTAGTLTMIPFPVYPAASLIFSTAGSKVEVLIGGNSYSILP